MDFRVEELAPCRKKVTVTVPAAQVREVVDEQYSEINKQLRLPGFRPGKAPRKLLETRFGVQVKDEAKSKLVESAYKAAIEEKKVAPLGQPTLDVSAITIDPEKDFEFAFEVTTRPEFALPEWKGREVKVPQVSVTDADVDLGVERMLLSDGTLASSTAPVAADDVAVLDWSARADGQDLHAEPSAYYRMGRGVLDGIVAPGLDAALTGAETGAKAVVKGRAAADDPRPALAGREFDLAVELKEAKRFQPADLDATFLKRHDFDDADELRKDVRRRLLRGRERERDRVAEDRLIDGLVATADMPLPPDVVENAVEGWIERRRIEAQSQGVSDEEVAKDLAASKEEIRVKVENDLKRHFVLERICESSTVTVDENEMFGAVEQMARESGRSTGELVQHFQESPERLSELRTHLRHEKAREALRKAAVVVEEASAPAPVTPPKKGK